MLYEFGKREGISGCSVVGECFQIMKKWLFANQNSSDDLNVIFTFQKAKVHIFRYSGRLN